MEKYNKHKILSPGVGGGGGVFPSIGYIILGMCRTKGYGFWAFLVWYRVSLLTILVLNSVL